MQHQVVRHGRGKGQRSALGRQHQVRFGGTEVLHGVLRHVRRAKLRWMIRGNRRQRDHNHRLGIAKRGRHVQAKIERVLLLLGRQGKRRDVLILCRMNRTQDACQVDHRAHVGAELSRAKAARVAQLAHHVRRRAAGHLRHHRLRIRVVQHQTFGMLHQAGRLLLRRFVKALLIDAHAQAAGSQRGLLFQRLGVLDGSNLDLGEVIVQPQPVPAGLLQVLRCPDKRARPVVYRLAQRGEIPRCLRSQEEQGLFRFRRNHDKHTLLPRRVFPRFYPAKPVIRRRIRCAAQKGNNQYVMRRLRRRQVGMDPEPVARLQIRHLRNRERLPISLHVHIDLWPRQVKGRCIRANQNRGHQQNKYQRRNQKTASMGDTTHSYIVRMRLCRRTDASRLPPPRSVLPLRNGPSQIGNLCNERPARQLSSVVEHPTLPTQAFAGFPSDLPATIIATRSRQRVRGYTF